MPRQASHFAWQPHLIFVVIVAALLTALFLFIAPSAGAIGLGAFASLA